MARSKRRSNSVLVRGSATSAVESLEARVLLSAFIVTDGNDSGSGSLRQAIIDSNSTTGSNVISFQILGTAVHTISLVSPLPAITTPVTIDGSTQPGFSNSPLIKLDGSGAGATADGLTLQGSSITVQDVAVTNFQGNGVVVLGNTNIVQNDTFSSNAGAGIVLTGGAASNQVTADSISGNKVAGVLISAGATHDRLKQNSIMGNTGPGVRITDTGTVANLLGGNTIQGNSGGGLLISAGASSNITASPFSDAISGNGTAGVVISGAGTNDNQIGIDGITGNSGPGVLIQSGAQSNQVSATVSGNGTTTNAPGVQIEGVGTSSNVVANVVSQNRGAGVVISGGATLNRVGAAPNSTSIYDNGGAGVLIEGAGTDQNTVTGCSIGIEPGTMPPPQKGPNAGGAVDVRDGAQSNQIGGQNTVAGYVIIEGSRTDRNVVTGNTLDHEPLNFKAGGVLVRQGARNNQIGGSGNAPAAGGNDFSVINVVVMDAATTGNSIRGNLFVGADLGPPIDLGGDGISANHGTVLEPGPNDFQNHPVLLSASGSVVSGALTSQPSSPYIIDVYAVSAASAAGFGGGNWIAQATVSTDPSGHARFFIPASIAPGQWVSATATAANGDTSEFSLVIPAPTEPVSVGQSNWTSVGPSTVAAPQPASVTVFESGPVIQLLAEPSSRPTTYAVTDNAIWKTTDSGAHWTSLTDGLPSHDFAGSYNPLVRSSSGTLYAASSGPGGAILKSVDAGATWSALGTGEFADATFSTLAISPDSKTLYVCVRHGAADGGGIYASVDGGNTWVNTTAALHGGASDLIIDPANPSILYAGQVEGGATNGIYKSVDGGADWVPLASSPLTGSAVGGTIRLAIGGTSPEVIYAIIFDPALGNAPDGLPNRFSSSDAGATWQQMAAVPNPDPRIWDVALSATVRVYSNGKDGLYTYYGNWSGGGFEPININIDWAGEPLVASKRGIYYLFANGSVPGPPFVLGAIINAPIMDLLTVTAATDDPNTIYGIADSENTALESSGSEAWNSSNFGDDAGKVLVDPTNSNRLYFYDPQNPAKFISRSDDAGAHWKVDATGIPTAGAGLALAYASEKAFVVDPSNHDRLLLGTDRVYETTNDANAWHPVSPVLSAGHFITALGISQSQPYSVYAPTDDGKLFATTDDSNWQERDSGLPLDSANHVLGLSVNPNNPQRVFAVTGDFLGGASGSGHVWMTTDGGMNWINVSGNLPPQEGGQSLAVDWRFALPVLYVGTLRGVYSSTDVGAHWSAFGSGLPRVIVTDLQFQPQFNVLTAATYGRGAFQMLVTAPLAGDANGDGVVDFTDLVTVARNYGLTSGATWQQGDFNADGSVGFDDLVIVARNYGKMAQQTTAAAVNAAILRPSNGAGSLDAWHRLARRPRVRPVVNA